MLDPQVIVNLLLELRVRVDLMGRTRWVDEGFTCRAGWSLWIALSVSAFGSETDEFHKQPFTWVDFSRSARNEERSPRHALNSSPPPDASRFQVNLEIARSGVSAYG